GSDEIGELGQALNNMIERLVELIDREYKAVINQRNAEYRALQSQIQPHFLFNSLNSINALVVSEPHQARKMIQNLSDFLRGTLKKDENKPVLLKEEIELLKLYLDIEKVRFGHRMSIDFNVEESALDKTLPPLLLQPIVENAIKFGLYNVLSDVKITISATTQANALLVTVTNPFDEKTAVTRRGEGFGLSLIQRRLQLIYHRADLLKIEKQEGVFKTLILIPQS
ncbi:MAG: sensor histidine kinase, partial [Bacteroidia bacterium]